MLENKTILTRRRLFGAVLLGLLPAGVLVLAMSQVLGFPNPRIAAGFSSSLLSFMLVVLYWQQAGIMQNQESLMEKEHDSTIVGYIGGTRDLPEVYLENIGPSAAYDIHATCNIGAETIEMESPLLQKGEKISNAIPSAGDSETIGLKAKSAKILDDIEEGKINETAHILIKYHNSIDQEREEEWERDLSQSIRSVRTGDYQKPTDTMEGIHKAIQSVDQTIDDIVLEYPHMVPDDDSWEEES